MRILALETSGNAGSVAALDQMRLLLELPLAQDQRSAQSLVPTIDRVLSEVGWAPADLALIAVTEGPGSFTGLRIGVTTAKAVAYATACQVIGVNTLEVIARQAGPVQQPLWAVLDAQRGELFAARFAPTPSGRQPDPAEVQLVGRGAWLAGLAQGDMVSGPGLRGLVGELGPQITVVEPALWQPTATLVGLLGFEHFQAGRRDDVFQLAPRYIRRAAAEEQWQRRHGAAG